MIDIERNDIIDYTNFVHKMDLEYECSKTLIYPDDDDYYRLYRISFDIKYIIVSKKRIRIWMRDRKIDSILT